MLNDDDTNSNVLDDNAVAMFNVAPSLAVVTDDVAPGDSISNVGRRTCSSAGHSSHRSSRSSASSARLKAEAERAALLAMAASIKEKHELEAQEEQIMRKRELLELQSQIAAHTAKVTVPQSIESDVQSVIAPSNGMNSYLERSKRKSSLRPSAVEFLPQSSKHQLNPSSSENCKAVMKAQHKDLNHQVNHHQLRDNSAAMPMEAKSSWERHELLH